MSWMMMMVMMPKRGDLAQPRQLSPRCHPKRSTICCWCCIYLGFVKYNNMFEICNSWMVTVYYIE